MWGTNILHRKYLNHEIAKSWRHPALNRLTLWLFRTFFFITLIDNSQMYFYDMFFSLSTMNEYVTKGWAINGTTGGLILGPSHDEGGIMMWQRTTESDGYRLKGEIEGYEYILNPGASHCYRNIFSSINKHDEHEHEDWEEYTIPEHISIMDTRRTGEPKFILLDANFSIVNKYSTKCYLNTIERMNIARSFEMLDDKILKIVYADLAPIEIYNSCTNELEGTLAWQDKSE